MNYELLRKSYWNINDIATYYDCNLEKANEIKKTCEREFGKTPFGSGKDRGQVRSDDVIKTMGGISRENELEIAIKLNQLEKREVINNDLCNDDSES